MLRGERMWIDLSIEVPAHTLTQPPMIGGEVRYQNDSSYTDMIGHNFVGLRNAWRIALETTEGSAFPYRFALSREPAARIYDKTNTLLPATPGTQRLRLDVPVGTGALRIALVRGSDAPIPFNELHATPRAAPAAASSSPARQR
jgi:hypothetical protein